MTAFGINPAGIASAYWVECQALAPVPTCPLPPSAVQLLNSLDLRSTALSLCRSSFSRCSTLRTWWQLLILVVMDGIRSPARLRALLGTHVNERSWWADAECV